MQPSIGRRAARCSTVNPPLPPAPTSLDPGSQPWPGRQPASVRRRPARDSDSESEAAAAPWAVTLAAAGHCPDWQVAPRRPAAVPSRRQQQAGPEQAGPARPARGGSGAASLKYLAPATVALRLAARRRPGPGPVARSRSGPP